MSEGYYCLDPLSLFRHNPPISRIAPRSSFGYGNSPHKVI